jgi:hypothetical protein
MRETILAEWGYRPLPSADKAEVIVILRADPPETSALNFTDMWRHHYRPWFKAEANCLILSAPIEGQKPFGLAPPGCADYQALAMTAFLLPWAGWGKPAQPAPGGKRAG